MRALLTPALLLALLAGCASTPPSTPGTPAAAPKVSLADEQRSLAQLFRDTPVVVALQNDSSLRVDVPLQYSFDSKASIVKPPLAKVLERVARVQRRQATRLRLAAPGDAGSTSTQLARERAASMRDYLVAQGVAATRFDALSAVSGELVQIVVADVQPR